MCESLTVEVTKLQKAEDEDSMYAGSFTTRTTVSTRRSEMRVAKMCSSLTMTMHRGGNYD